MALTLYAGSGSPFAWRVQLALEHKALPYELKMLSFSARDTLKPEFIALNPRHQVPVLVDGDFVLYESNAIVEYLDEAYPGRGAPLFPGDARQRALVRRLIEEIDNYYLRGHQPGLDAGVLEEAGGARSRQDRRGAQGGRRRDRAVHACDARRFSGRTAFRRGLHALSAGCRAMARRDEIAGPRCGGNALAATARMEEADRGVAEFRQDHSAALEDAARLNGGQGNAKSGAPVRHSRNANRSVVSSDVCAELVP